MRTLVSATIVMLAGAPFCASAQEGVTLASYDRITVHGALTSSHKRTRVIEELLGSIRDTDGILAQRASVSIQQFLTDDAVAIAGLAGRVDPTAWHNLRAWLFRTFLPRTTNAFANMVRQSGLTEDGQLRLVNEFTNVANRRSVASTRACRSCLATSPTCETWRIELKCSPVGRLAFTADTAVASSSRSS